MNLYIVDIYKTILHRAGVPSFPDGTPREKIKEIRRIIKDSSSFIIFTAMGEKWSVTSINRFLNILQIKHDHPRILFVLDSLTTKKPNETINFNNWILYSSQLMKVACWEEQYGANKDINLDTKKFLFLMGKPYKRWRINTLYSIYKKSLFKNCVYSFKFFDNEAFKKTRAVLKDLSDDEFDKFVNSTQKDLDYPVFNWSMLGLPIDTSLYKHTSFSLISETTCDSVEPWFLSEKTWRTIANHHCFVPLYTEATYDYIHNLGIKTFQKILPCKKQDFNFVNNCLLTDEQVDNIINQSLLNVEFLLENISDQKNYVSDVIIENYDTYQQLIQSHRKKIPQKLEEFFYLHVESNLSYMSVRNIDSNLAKVIIKKLWG